MPGIFPDVTAGGIVIRNEGGTCTRPSTVQQAYCPSASFTTSCQITALPSDCTARITPAQINAFQSELLCFAETLDPDGAWDCSSLCNLSTMFKAWETSYVPNPDIIAGAICAAESARTTLATCLISGDENNAVVIGSDGGLYVDPNPDATQVPLNPVIENLGTVQDAIAAIIEGGFARVVVGGALSGNGHASDPLSVRDASQEETGVVRFATPEEVADRSSGVALSPADLPDSAPTFRPTISSPGTLASLSSTGTTTSTGATMILPNLRDVNSTVILDIYLSCDVNVRGNGAVDVHLQYSIDDGATWPEFFVSRFEDAGNLLGAQRNRNYIYPLTAVRTIPPQVTTTFMLRSLIEVSSAFDAGASITVVEKIRATMFPVAS